MKVLFLYPIPDPKYHIIRYHHGLGYLSSVLKKARHQVKLDYVYKYDEGRISSIIDDFKPELIGVTVATNQFALSSQVTRYIYKRYNLPVIWGGDPCYCCSRRVLCLRRGYGPLPGGRRRGYAGICGENGKGRRFY